MVRLLAIVALWAVVLVACIGAYEQQAYNPIANKKALVVLNNARFTILTPQLIRMEYSGTGKFEDRPTWAVLNRLTVTPRFTVKPVASKPGWSEIRTSALSIQYNTKSAAFDSGSVLVTLLTPVGSNRNVTWVPGQSASGNLLGTIRSLDQIEGSISLNCTENSIIKVHDEDLHCAWGLISRDGWTVLDDTKGPYLDDNEWPSPQGSADDSDLYFFGHGHDYKQALYDYTLIGLQIPMTPKYVHGIMWSRWYAVSTTDTREIVEEYVSRSMPLDVYIIDMDWHLSPPANGSNWQNYWTGFTWDPNLFPNPVDAMGYLKQLGLHVGVNIHDASGVQLFEQYYNEMAKANGINPSTGNPINFNVTSELYMSTLHSIVMQPLLDGGLDFWWTDWQQGGTTGVYINGVNPTYMTNWYRNTWQARQVAEGTNKTAQIRGFSLARWGGMGNHRYQTGFSGDVDHKWDSLAYQPYFTSTASNVGYGYWSHDIMGGLLDYELSTRWIQWGAVSPLFRSHDAGGSAGGCADNPGECSLGNCDPVKIWEVPNYNFEINRRAVRLRAQLLPYFYTLAREAYDSGVGPARPMYYNNPEADYAYTVQNQYNLGDDMIVAPVVQPGDSQTKLATTSIWLPQGVWVDRESGAVHSINNAAGEVITKSWDLSEIPIFVRGGAVIPSIPNELVGVTGNAHRQYPGLVWTIYPGANTGIGRVYDDDGISMDYQQNQVGWYSCSYKRTPNATSILIATDMYFPGMVDTRPVTIKLVNELPPAFVVVNKTMYPFSTTPQPGTWSFDPVEVAVTISIPNATDIGWDNPTDAQITLYPVPWPQGQPSLSGVKGVVHRAKLAKELYDQVRVSINLMTNVTVSRETAYRLSVNANKAEIFSQNLYDLKPTFLSGIAQLQAVGLQNAQRKAQAIALVTSIVNDIQTDG